MRIARVKVDGALALAEERNGAFHRIDGAADLPALMSAGRESYRVADTPLAGATVTSPLRPNKIVAIGLNYLDHMRECNMEVPTKPLVFAKFPSSVIGEGEAISIDAEVTERVDWEVELAAVIGRTARHVAEADALSHIYGYTVANDVSARDVQFADGQWVRGKSLDTFCPLGPVVVTADEIAEPQALALRTRVNGETVQDSSTAEMVFGVA